MVNSKRLASLVLIYSLLSGCKPWQPTVSDGGPLPGESMASFQLRSNREELDKAEFLGITIQELERQMRKNISNASIKYVGKKVRIFGKLTYLSHDISDPAFSSIGVGKSVDDDIFCSSIPSDQISELTVGESQIEIVGVISWLDQFDGIKLGPCIVSQNQSS